MHVTAAVKSQFVIIDNAGFTPLHSTRIVRRIDKTIQITAIEITETPYLLHQLHVQPEQLHHFHAYRMTDVSTVSTYLNKQVAGRGRGSAIFTLHIRKRSQFSGNKARIQFRPETGTDGNHAGEHGFIVLVFVKIEYIQHAGKLSPHRFCIVIHDIQQ